MESLAVRYRPQKFSQVVEQGSAKIILQQQLESGEIQHAYLFTGSQGVGKTTIGRIFANEINKGVGKPIEIDAASNNSVDDVRNIIQQSKVQSMDGEYRIWLIDECFPSNSMISTPTGSIPISQICTGDTVKSMCGYNKVTHVFKSSVLTSRLCCVKVNQRNIITTLDHLFFTDIGWVKAVDLHKGDRVYGTEDLSELWQEVSDKTQNSEILLSSVFGRLSKDTLSAKDEDRDMCSLWQTVPSEELSEYEDMFKGVYEGSDFKVRKNNLEYRIWHGTTETIIRKNVQAQPNECNRKCAEDDCYENKEWNIKHSEELQGWEWEVHDTTNNLVASIRRWLGIGVGNSNGLSSTRTSVSYVLQSRPWITRNDACSRGGWQKPQLEKAIIERCEERRVSEVKRVDSVEVYKRGYNDELFRGSFTDTELSQEYVTLYDIEVENDHSYFVENTLVHNCHALSSNGWQAFLKILEEPPSKAVFLFCTTNPEKVPKTILSRVQRFDFKRISQQGIIDRLKYILDTEKSEGRELSYTEDAISYLARISEGGLRDSITLTDKCLAYSTDLTLENVIQALGTVDYEVFFKLSDAILNKDSSDVIKVIESVHADGKDLKQFIKDYMSFLLDINKYDILHNFDYLQIPNTYENVLQKHTQEWFNVCRNLLPVIVKLNADLKWETQVKVAVEARLIREVI